MTIEPISPTPPEPVATPMMRQRWELVSFLHWRLDAAEVRTLVPRELEIDVFDGSAWVGLVPFRMISRVTGTPTIPWLSTFAETNVRTYVIGPDGRRGIWFLSLDVGRWPVAVAGTMLGLPYRWSRMDVEGAFGDVGYRARRIVPPGAGVESRVTVVSNAATKAASPLDHFLTARFRMYGMGPLGLFAVQVEHRPWTLHPGRASELRDGFVPATGLRSPSGEPLVHHSTGVRDVRLGLPERVRGAAGMS